LSPLNSYNFSLDTDLVYFSRRLKRVSKFLLSITVEQLDETKLRDHIKEAA